MISYNLWRHAQVKSPFLHSMWRFMRINRVNYMTYFITLMGVSLLFMRVSCLLITSDSAHSQNFLPHSQNEFSYLNFWSWFQIGLKIYQMQLLKTSLEPKLRWDITVWFFLVFSVISLQVYKSNRSYFLAIYSLCFQHFMCPVKFLLSRWSYMRN